MQGNDFVQSLMYTRGVTCFSCHDVHGTANNADLIKPAQRSVPDLPRPELAERAARARRIEAAHASRAGQRRQRVRRLPHAEDRADDRRRQRPQPHVRVHHARDDGEGQGSECLHRMSHRSHERMGYSRATTMVASSPWRVD